MSHQKTIAAAKDEIAAIAKKRQRIEEERSKLIDSLAVLHGAQERHEAEAATALALAAIGDGSAADAQKAEAQAGATANSVRKAKAALAGLDAQLEKLDANDAAAKARIRDEERAVHDERWELVRKRLKASRAAFVADMRAAFACDRARMMNGFPSKPLLRANGECWVPAFIDDDERMVGPNGNMHYVSGGGHERFDVDGPQLDALESEVEGLSRDGVEV